jgi:hypothetical protein
MYHTTRINAINYWDNPALQNSHTLQSRVISPNDGPTQQLTKNAKRHSTQQDEGANCQSPASLQINSHAPLEQS